MCKTQPQFLASIATLSAEVVPRIITWAEDMQRAAPSVLTYSLKKYTISGKRISPSFSQELPLKTTPQKPFKKPQAETWAAPELCRSPVLPIPIPIPAEPDRHGPAPRPRPGPAPVALAARPCASGRAALSPLGCSAQTFEAMGGLEIVTFMVNWATICFFLKCFRPRPFRWSCASEYFIPDPGKSPE